MKTIQTKEDIEYLETNGFMPDRLIELIKQEFLELLESEAKDWLPNHLALVILEHGDHILDIIGQFWSIEYIERLTDSELEYYRIAKRIDQDIQLIYSLVGIHNKETEQWLKEKAAYWY